jgi:hypothetical protein
VYENQWFLKVGTGSAIGELPGFIRNKTVRRHLNPKPEKLSLTDEGKER